MSPVPPLRTVSAPVRIVGGGFAGLSAAWEIARRGIPVTVLEADDEVGGLAGSFDVGGQRLEKFYHHWFTNDTHVTDLVRDLGADGDILMRPTRTGMYFANKTFRLSTPLDLLRFSALAPLDRVRLGLLALQARRVKDWRALEGKTAAQWLREMGGDAVYRVVWEPLLVGKFGPYAEEVGAVWFWNKLKLRGGSRGKGGAEYLAYYRGGFAALADRLAREVERHGGEVRTGVRVLGLRTEEGRVTGVETSEGMLDASAVIATPSLPLIADLAEAHLPADFVARMRAVQYLANVCLVLELDRSLSDTYWLNVNDPTFPYVGVIEHTNFEPASSYGGKRIVYLSKYLPESAELFRMSDDEVLEFTIPHLKKMFPAFDRSWITRHHVWRARWSQPVVGTHYSRMIPPVETPLGNFFISTMAQIYPEDRGTNYAIREGRKVGVMVADRVGGGAAANAGAREEVAA